MQTRQRFRNQDNALKARFTLQVLQDEGKELIDAHHRAISEHLNEHTGKLRSSLQNAASQQGHGATLTITHLKRQRFLDMKTRNTKQGRIKTKTSPIHNKILFGRLGNIIRKLSYGFTDAVREQMKQLEQDLNS